MTITTAISKDESEFTIKVEGRFDFSVLQLFRNSYERNVKKFTQYIVDLKESDYLDSSALGMLLALRDHAQSMNANVKIINCNNDIRKILVVTKLDELFTIE